MIHSFACKQTEAIWRGERSARLPGELQQLARRKLRMLANAHTLDDLRVPPSNRLEKLRGDLSGWYSVRINLQWRLCFRWQDGAHQVRMVDYH
jgi:proteic killer suppression protein